MSRSLLHFRGIGYIKDCHDKTAQWTGHCTYADGTMGGCRGCLDGITQQGIFFFTDAVFFKLVQFVTILNFTNLF